MASSRRLRALITNDDGIDSPGLWALAGGARDAGFDVIVAAPHADMSGVGGSIWAVRSPAGEVRLHRRELPGLDGIPAYAVEGHPAFIVHSAGRGWIDPEPDVVLSGINPGANLGHAVLHSGTIGAALAAGLHGWRALAVSLGVPLVHPNPPHWESALHLLPEVLDMLLASADGTVLTLNVPNLPVAELGQLREARLADFRSVHVPVDHVDDGTGGGVLKIHGMEYAGEPAPGTDTALVGDGHPTITELRAVRGEPGFLPVPPLEHAG